MFSLISFVRSESDYLCTTKHDFANLLDAEDLGVTLYDSGSIEGFFTIYCQGDFWTIIHREGAGDNDNPKYRLVEYGVGGRKFEVIPVGWKMHMSFKNKACSVRYQEPVMS